MTSMPKASVRRGTPPNEATVSTTNRQLWLKFKQKIWIFKSPFSLKEKMRKRKLQLIKVWHGIFFTIMADSCAKPLFCYFVCFFSFFFIILTHLIIIHWLWFLFKFSNLVKCSCYFPNSSNLSWWNLRRIDAIYKERSYLLLLDVMQKSQKLTLLWLDCTGFMWTYFWISLVYSCK